MERPDEQFTPPIPDPSPDQDKGEKPRRSKRWRVSGLGIGKSGMVVLFGVVVLVFIYALIDRLFLSPPVEPEVVIDGKQHVIQLDVLNGSGVPKMAQRFTDYLRARGFDVVEMGNYRESDLPTTLVLDRSGNPQAAEQVADALGIPREQVRQQIDRNAYLDVTVIIGNDFRTLKPLL